MSRINTNITALIGARILTDNTNNLNKSLIRLSTGLRINKGSDDPAGLIASENLRSQIRGTDTAVKNAERANTIVATAEGALTEVSSMLLDVQALLGEVANKGGMSTEEIDANQAQVDSIINSINRVANTTEFAGKKLLDGNLGYMTSGIVTSDVAETNINSAKLIDGAEMTVDVTVQTAAETGRVSMNITAIASTTLTLQVGSNRGTTELTFAIGSNASGVASGINAVKEITGISATATGSVLTTFSVDFGTGAFASVEALQTTTGFSVQGGGTSAKDFGANVSATVNGASATGDGKRLTVRTAMLDAEIDLSVAFATATATAATSFTITGGGSDFSLGSSVMGLGLEPIGIQSVVAGKLGNTTDGFLNTLRSGGDNSLKSTNLITAQNIVDSAIKDVTSLRGRLGNFQKNTLETTINTLKITGENLRAAESAIRDTDFAAETSNLTRNQILVQSATSILAQANFAPQSVLSLLG
jgi:flagellin